VWPAFKCITIAISFLQDIRARTGGPVTQDVGLEALTYVGAVLSMIGLVLTAIALVGSK